MIVKDHEKKAVGFISVTQITARAHVSAYLARTRCRHRICRCSPRRWAGRSCRWVRCACHHGTRTPAAVTAGPMMP